MISDVDNPPFAPDSCCKCCGKPWIEHPSLTKLCNANQNLITVLRATAINNHDIYSALAKVIDAFENKNHPQSPNPSNQQDFPLQGDGEAG